MTDEQILIVINGKEKVGMSSVAIKISDYLKDKEIEEGKFIPDSKLNSDPGKLFEIENKSHQREYHKLYAEEHKEEIRDQQREYMKDYMKEYRARKKLKNLAKPQDLCKINKTNTNENNETLH